jgi:anaerobic selenocysteine-containing dehydrogenase
VQSDETLVIRPGTDAALALGMMHVIVGERLHDAEFVARNTVGFDALAVHLEKHSPQWAADVTGIASERIVALARRYATMKPAMIVLGGNSSTRATTDTAGRASGWMSSRAHRQYRCAGQRPRPASRQRHCMPSAQQ